MESTIEITQHLEMLNIVANGPIRSMPTLRQSSTSTTAAHHQETSISAVSPVVVTASTTAPSGIPAHESDDDADMLDDITAGTANLSLQPRQRVSWPRLHHRRRTGAAAANSQITSCQTSHSPRAAHARPGHRTHPRTRPSRRGSDDASRFIRQCAQTRARQSSRAPHRLPHTPVSPRVQSSSEAYLTRE